MTFKARPTVYRGIQMRSRLEAYYAQWLDSVGLVWKYEPTCLAGPDGQWVPDFQVWFSWWGDPVGVTDYAYVEVKPPGFNHDTTRRRMEAARASAPYTVFILAGTDDLSYHSFPYSLGGTDWQKAAWAVGGADPELKDDEVVLLPLADDERDGWEYGVHMEDWEEGVCVSAGIAIDEFIRGQPSSFVAGRVDA